MAVGVGAGLVTMFRPSLRPRLYRRDDRDSQRIDEASEDSFPASDPPSFSGTASQPANISTM